MPPPLRHFTRLPNHDPDREWSIRHSSSVIPSASRSSSFFSRVTLDTLTKLTKRLGRAYLETWLATVFAFAMVRAASPIRGKDDEIRQSVFSKFTKFTLFLALAQILLKEFLDFVYLEGYEVLEAKLFHSFRIVPGEMEERRLAVRVNHWYGRQGGKRFGYIESSKGILKWKLERNEGEKGTLLRIELNVPNRVFRMKPWEHVPSILEAFFEVPQEGLLVKSPSSLISKSKTSNAALAVLRKSVILIVRRWLAFYFMTWARTMIALFLMAQSRYRPWMVQITVDLIKRKRIGIVWPVLKLFKRWTFGISSRARRSASSKLLSISLMLSLIQIIVGRLMSEYSKYRRKSTWFSNCEKSDKDDDCMRKEVDDIVIYLEKS